MLKFRSFLDTPNKRKAFRNTLLLIPGIAGDFVIHSDIVRNGFLMRVLTKADRVYLIVIALLICSSLLHVFLDLYNRSDRSRHHPLNGLVQALEVALVFVGIIIITSTLIDKSPTALLTGLGASAAVLMLIFKDSILGFVSGSVLIRNNMIRIGDWIQMPDGSANGTVEEITLNTVKVRNWDNTISTIPPYTLINTTFKNWRGMQESPGRRVDKMIRIDVSSLQICTEDMIRSICTRIPLMVDYTVAAGEVLPTNTELYRVYIERYLRSHHAVVQELDMIIAQREVDQVGLPIEVYFFLGDKVWNEYERLQSDIFDHLMAMAGEFGLKLYQLQFKEGAGLKHLETDNDYP